MESLFGEYASSSDSDEEKEQDGAQKRQRDPGSSGSSDGSDVGSASASESDSDSRAAKKRTKRVAEAGAAVGQPGASSLGSADDLFASTSSTFLVSNSTFEAPALDKAKDQAEEKEQAAAANAAAAAQMRADGERVARCCSARILSCKK